MEWRKEDIEHAFLVYHQLLQHHGTLSTHHQALIQSYHQSEIREIIEQIIEPIANVKIFQTEERFLHLVPHFDNALLGFSNAELREQMGLHNNQELYLACFVILVILSKFYNSDVHRITTRAFVTVETIEQSIQDHMNDFAGMHPEVQDRLLEDSQLDFAGMYKVWSTLPVYNEKAKQIQRTDKNRIGFILKVCRFMKKHGLFVVRENREIELTDKLKRIMNHYYFNENRKQTLFDLLCNNRRGN